MAGLTYQLFAVAVFIGAIELLSGYSFYNCIEDQLSNRQSFKCIKRKESKMTAIVKDLPQSTINLTITLNPVRYIPCGCFVNLTNLQWLRLDRNNISTIYRFAFQNLTQLQYLNLSFNHISELNSSLFDDLHSLTFLSLTNNKLKHLPEGIFPTHLNLNALIVRQNFLTNFSEIAESVSHLKNLRIVDLCFNNLTSLEHSNVSLPTSLNRMYICRNSLSTLGCSPSFLKHIKVLDLSYNPMLPTMAFREVILRNVSYLRLRSTSVKIVEFLNTSDIDAGHVDFSGTGLKNATILADLCKLLSEKVTNLQNLILSNNGIGNPSELSYCPNISNTLDLSRNQLKRSGCLEFLTRHLHLKKIIAEHNHFTSLPSCGQSKSLNELEDLSFRYSRILSVNDCAFCHTPNLKRLKLNINSIAFLHVNALKRLRKLEELRLDNNLLSDLFRSTFDDLHNLQILNLRNNRIAVIFDGTFHSLNNLTTLDLGGNKITHFEPSGLAGLKSLSKFYLDGNNLKTIDSSQYHIFQHTLTVLDLQRNQISFLDGNFDHSPFINLTKLHDLKLDGQQPYGLTILPRTLFRGLHSLTSLYLTNNKITYFFHDVFDDLTSLNFLTLDNCCVGVTQLQPGIFKNLRKLKKLAVENMGIQNISKEVFGNLSQLQIIQLNHNVMQSIQVDALESLPKLHYLDIRNVPLSCTCTNRLLKNWTVKNPNTQVVYLYNLKCPHNENVKFFNFDTKVCYVDLGEFLFFSTALGAFLFTIIPLLYVKLYWKVKYSYYVFRSWFSEQWRRLREKEENCEYDAFISYNSSDEQWVMDELLPNLEGKGSSFKLCLHHRDFEPGRYIIDNIVSAVYSSRKTVCVVSRNFLRSEWCSMEIQLASYRLFDEHRDVLLLVLLEPISERQLSSYHRMRKVMLQKTYLQWPGSDCTNPTQAQDLFWNQLRRAIRTGSRSETDENCTSKDRIAESQNTEQCGAHEPEENYCLLP